MCYKTNKNRKIYKLVRFTKLMLDFTKEPTTFYFTANSIKKVLLEVVPHPMLLIPLDRKQLIQEIDNYKEKIVGKYITAKQLAYLKVERDKGKEPEYLLEKDLVLLEEYFARYPGSKIKQTEYAIIKTLVEAGCRVSELCDLDVKGVDPEIDRIRVLGKGKKWRWIRGSNVVEILRSFKQRYHCEKNPFFKNSYDQEYQPLFLNSDGKPFTPRNIQKFMANINKKLPGLSHPLHPHLLRHTYAVLQVLHNPTQSIVTLKENMGHSDVRTTQIYFSMSEPELERLAKKTPELKKEEKVSQKTEVKVETVENSQEMKFCMFCGKNILSIAKFCSTCGGKQ